MRPIAPRLDVGEEQTFAEEQAEYLPLVATRVLHTDDTVTMVTRWTLTPDERARITAGEDVYISFPTYVFPHSVSLRPDWAKPFSEISHG